MLAWFTSPTSATAPTSTSQPVSQPSAPFVSAVSLVTHYEIKARVNLQKGIIEGQATITWRNRTQTPAKELLLHLYLNAFRSKDTLFYKGSRGQSRGNEVKLDDPGSIEATRAIINGQEYPIEETNDGTTAKIALPAPVEPGAEVVVRIPFVDDLPPISARAGKSPGFVMGGQWFPKLGVFTDQGWECEPYYAFGEFFSDFGSYDVTLEIPRGAVVAASGGPGEKLPDTQEGLQVYRFQVSAVHDFAFAVSDLLEEETFQVDDVSVRLLYPKGSTANAARHRDAIERGLPLFEEWLGEYPYPWLTVIQVPEKARGAGGMEYPTLITTWGLRETPLFQSYFMEQTTLHELAHQWFYGLVASNEVRSPFLDEGLTTYATQVAMKKLYGSLIDSPSGLLTVDPEEVSRLQAMVGESFDPIAQAANLFRDGPSYGSASYARTALALASIRELSAPGAFDQAIGAYARRFRFQHPTPEDLERSLSQSLQREIGFFWKQAFLQSGEFDYAVSELREAEKEIEVTIERRGAQIAPTRVLLHFQDDSVAEALWSEEAQKTSSRGWERFLFPQKEGLVWAEAMPLPSEYWHHGNAVWSKEYRSSAKSAAFGTLGGFFQFIGSLAVLSGW